MGIDTNADFDLIDDVRATWPIAVKETIQFISDMLLKKHAQYGSSIFRPMTILSQSSTEEQIRMRIDDRIHKLTKLSMPELEGEHGRRIIYDLTGFLINYCAFQHVHNPEVWGVINE